MYHYLRMHVDRRDFEMPTEARVSVASDAFRLLSDPTRIKLLWALLQGESSVSCLAELVQTFVDGVVLGVGRAHGGAVIRSTCDPLFWSTPMPP